MADFKGPWDDEPPAMYEGMGPDPLVPDDEEPVDDNPPAIVNDLDDEQTEAETFSDPEVGTCAACGDATASPSDTVCPDCAELIAGDAAPTEQWADDEVGADPDRPELMNDPDLGW